MSDVQVSAGSASSRTLDLLRRVVDPAKAAVVTMELQSGVVGREAVLPNLRDEVARVGLLDVVRGVCDSARGAGIRVVHCTHEVRPDGAGATINCKIFARSERVRVEQGTAPTQIGTPGVELVEGLFDPRDILVPRTTGMTPFTSTPLDQILRNIGVTTVIAVGVSVNLGIFGMALSALDLGYQVVLVRDAVAGVPYEYAQAVIDNSLSLISTVVTASELRTVFAECAALTA
jgi:nicotinamidase-related amidase